MPNLISDTLIKGTKVLSEREVEVLALSADGYSNKQLAAKLHISDDTIDTHNRNIVAKLGARNMKQAIAIGIRTGVIE